MYISKPDWCRHSDSPIFSIDIHPDGTRFATGGGDYKIKIWNFSLLIGEQQATNSPRLLASLDEGFSVNCVRWSPNGRYLASGADNKLVCLYELRAKGTGTEGNLENWHRTLTFTGHTGDITDISWAPDSLRIVSCSLQGFEVFVWKIGETQPIAKLQGHDGWVKGLSWDPLGKYIATQSDDKSVIIWRTSDWRQNRKITEPFKKATTAAFFRRISWSPDGAFLTTTGGMNGKTHVAPIIERKSGELYCDFVGHNRPVVCSRFNPVLFKTKGGKKGSVSRAAYCAIGSQDCGVSVWTTVSTRPLMVAKDLFEQSVLDLTWGKDGYTLLCCSTDGTIACLEFDRHELGQPLRDEEFKRALQAVDATAKIGDSQEYVLAENPNQLELEAEAPEIEQNEMEIDELSNSFNSNSNSNLPPQIITAPPPEIPTGPVKQVESITSDGRRRIAPQFLGSITPSRSTTTILNNTQPSPTQAQPTAPIRPASPTSTVAKSLSAEKNNSTLTQKNSLKRSAPSSQKNIKKKPKLSNPTHSSKGPKISSNNITTPSSLTTSRTNNSTHRNRSERTNIINEGSNLFLLDLPKKRSVLNKQLYESEDEKSAYIEVNITDTDSKYIKSSIKVTLLEGSWRDTIYQRVTLVSGNSNFVSVACDDGSLFVYSVTGRRLMPVIALGLPIAILECNSTSHLMVITVDGMVYVWDILKRKRTAKVSISSLLFHITTVSKPSDEPVTDNVGSSSVTNVGASIDGKLGIERAELSDEGLPLVSLTNRQTFIFSKFMKVWMRVAGGENFSQSVFKSKLHGNFSDKNNNRLTSGTLSALQALSSMETDDVGDGGGMDLLMNDPRDQTIETISHIENQMVCAIEVNSPVEYKYWLVTYVRYLTSERNATRLEDLFKDLLGPVYRSDFNSTQNNNNSNWDQFILGSDKHSLLREMLPIVSKNRALQRLVNEYIELLNFIERKKDDDTDLDRLLSRSRNGSEEQGSSVNGRSFST